MSVAPTLDAGSRLEAELSPLIAGRPVALIDFPNHSNCGDSAIWAGEKAVLARIGARVSYSCDWEMYRTDHVRALPRDTVFLFHGGGNFGEAFWKRHHALRTRLLQDVPGRPVVQLPTSVKFSSVAAAREFGEVIAAHGDLTLFARERQSYEFARRTLPCDVRLAPDAALALRVPPIGVPAAAPLAVARDDAEATTSLAEAARRYGIRVDDWAPRDRQDQRSLAALAIRGLRAASRRLPPAAARSRMFTRLVTRTFDGLAQREVDRALAMLAGGSVLVTDRLHGHVLATLAGIPSVAVDTGYGKIRGLHEAWLQDVPGCRLAATPDEACELALQLASGS